MQVVAIVVPPQRMSRRDIAEWSGDHVIHAVAQSYNIAKMQLRIVDESPGADLPFTYPTVYIEYSRRVTVYSESVKTANYAPRRLRP